MSEVETPEPLLEVWLYAYGGYPTYKAEEYVPNSGQEKVLLTAAELERVQAASAEHEAVQELLAERLRGK